MLTYPCSTDIEVRRKAMSIILSMTSSRNVEEVVMYLKKQLQKTQEVDFEKVKQYDLYFLSRCSHFYDVGSRIPPTSHPIHPRHRH